MDSQPRAILSLTLVPEYPVPYVLLQATPATAAVARPTCLLSFPAQSLCSTAIVRLHPLLQYRGSLTSFITIALSVPFQLLKLLSYPQGLRLLLG